MTIAAQEHRIFVDLVERLERVLTRNEQPQIDAINHHIVAVRQRLLDMLAREYPKALKDIENAGEAARYLRARLLLAQLEGVLNFRPNDAEPEPWVDQIKQYVMKAQEDAVKEVRNAMDWLHLDAQTSAIAMATPNYDAAYYASENIWTRMTEKHQPEFIGRVQSAVVEGMLLGHGVRKVAREVRLASGMTMRAAETLVRTENHQAYDKALQASYRQVGVEFVVRIAVMDSRTCEYCAARAGAVYVLGEAPASLHPNDRCYMLPWSQQMIEDGTLDAEWLEQHRKEAQERSKAAGHPEVSAYDDAPFEKGAGTYAPPIYVPKEGFTLYGASRGFSVGEHPLANKPIVMIQDPLFNPATVAATGPLLRAAAPPERFESLAEAETYVKDVLGVPEVDLDGVSEKLWPEMTEELWRLKNYFPEAFARMPAITTYRHVVPHHTPGEFRRSSVLAHTTRAASHIAVNPYWFSDPSGMDAKLWKDFEVGWQVGTRPRDVITHEFGHILDFYLTSDKVPDSVKLRQIDYRNTELTDPNSLNYHGRETVSSYANHDHLENFAEHFTAMMLGQAAKVTVYHPRTGEPSQSTHASVHISEEGRVWPEQMIRYYEHMQAQAKDLGWSLPELPEKPGVPDAPEFSIRAVEEWQHSLQELFPEDFVVQ